MWHWIERGCKICYLAVCIGEKFGIEGRQLASLGVALCFLPLLVSHFTLANF